MKLRGTTKKSINHTSNDSMFIIGITANMDLSPQEMISNYKWQLAWEELNCYDILQQLKFVMI